MRTAWRIDGTIRVAPFTGAWIEMSAPLSVPKKFAVAPFTGAWIEIPMSDALFSSPVSRTLHGCVD